MVPAPTYVGAQSIRPTLSGQDRTLFGGAGRRQYLYHPDLADKFLRTRPAERWRAHSGRRATADAGETFARIVPVAVWPGTQRVPEQKACGVDVGRDSASRPPPICRLQSGPPTVTWGNTDLGQHRRGATPTWGNTDVGPSRSEDSMTIPQQSQPGALPTSRPTSSGSEPPAPPEPPPIRVNPPPIQPDRPPVPLEPPPPANPPPETASIRQSRMSFPPPSPPLSAGSFRWDRYPAAAGSAATARFHAV